MRGKVAVITGAGSGIGRALAVEAGLRGARLAISDVDVAGLEETARMAREAGCHDLLVSCVDVTAQAQVARYADQVVEQFGVVNLVINNAGIAFTGTVAASEYTDIAAVFDVDFWGVVHGTKEFLPHLIASGDGHLVAISSLFSLIAVPTQSAYNAAKSAVQGFTESLRMEMLTAGYPVDVSCVHPGGIKTAVARNARSARGFDAAAIASTFDTVLAITEPDKAARVILDGIEARAPRILVGVDAYVLDAMSRLFPVGYQRVVAVASRVSGL